MVLTKDHPLLINASNFVRHTTTELERADSIVEQSKHETNVIGRIKTLESLLQLLSDLDVYIEDKIHCVKLAADELEMNELCSEYIAELVKRSFDVLELMEQAKKLKLSAFITPQDYTIHLNYMIDTFDAGGVCMHNKLTLGSETINSKIYLNEIEKMQELGSTSVIWTKRNVYLTAKDAVSDITTQSINK